uniref:Uncharacterized protein n=1 Tax=Candidozyma auris TaxID=498019 RepID=A0A0L0P2Q5_CANAR
MAALAQSKPWSKFLGHLGVSLEKRRLKLPPGYYNQNPPPFDFRKRVPKRNLLEKKKNESLQKSCKSPGSYLLSQTLWLGVTEVSGVQLRET